MSATHRAPWDGKSSAHEGAAQVVLGVAVAPGKMRTCQLDHSSDLIRRSALAKQLPHNPQIYDAPIGLRKTLRNAPSLDAASIDPSGLGCGDPWWSCVLANRGSSALPVRRCAVSRKPHACWPSQRDLQQALGVASQTGAGIQDFHPGSIASRCAPLGLLVGEACQPSQMTPVGTGHVPAVRTSQLFADGCCHSGLQWGHADADPGLQVALASLEHYTGIMPVGPHSLHDRLVAAVEIDENIAGVLAFGVGVNVDIASLAIPNAQESYCCHVAQLGCRPKPFPREWPPGGLMNQADQIKIVRHRRKLATNGLSREKESAIEHGHHSAMDYPYRIMDSQRTVSSVLTDCLIQGAHLRQDSHQCE